MPGMAFTLLPPLSRQIRIVKFDSADHTVKLPAEEVSLQNLPKSMKIRFSIHHWLFIAGLLGASPLAAESFYYLTMDGKLAHGSRAQPAAGALQTITGVVAGETLVAIDFRPQNQRLYALGVNATANTATLYHVAVETGVATALSFSTIAFVDGSGQPVDFPDPATTDWDMDFNPAVDRLRVVNGAGLSFRVNPNTGAPVDGDQGGAAGSVAGVNLDGPINGGTTGVGGAAYTNNQPNNGNITTLYTLDAASDRLFIQNPPNTGTQASGPAVTLSGSPLNISRVTGFDILPSVDTLTSNASVNSGSGLFVGTVGGVSSIFSLNLVNGAAVLLGNTGVVVRSMAVVTRTPAAIGLDSGGTTLVRFNPAVPGTTTSVALASPVSGETLVAMDTRPQTGQLFGLGVNATADTATLYIVDPQTGAVTAVGTPGQIAFVNSFGQPVDFPSAATGYDIDFNPTVDRIRVIVGNGLNFRVNPNNGAPVDGDLGGGAGSLPGTNPDPYQNNFPSGGNGAESAAYTNSYGQSLTGGVTTLYTLDAEGSTLAIQNPANAGTQTSQLTVTVGGSPLAFTSVSGFDILPDVRVANSSSPAQGVGWALLQVAGTSTLYRINLTDGTAVPAGATGVALSDLVLWAYPSGISASITRSVGQFLIEGDVVAGKNYRFQRSGTLTSWTDIGSTLTASASGFLQFTETSPPAGRQFYRLREIP